MRRGWRAAALAVVVVLFVACAPTKKGAPGGGAGLYQAACAGRLGGGAVGQVESSDLTEISGMEASAISPGVLWMHNDSGDSARVFAMTATGHHLGWFTLAGAAHVDWEDIALGPGPQPGVSYLYVGDIGDNSEVRASIAVYRVAEPGVDANNPPGDGQTLAGVDTLVLQYPDGAHDAEALIVDPVTGDLVIVAKQPSGQAGVYVLPAGSAGGILTLAATIAVPFVTAGDVTSDGGAVVLRTYGSVLVFLRRSGMSLAGALQSAPCTGASASEPQGEAIAIAPNSEGYATTSEGLNPPINFFARR